jgi:hypothetical protein
MVRAVRDHRRLTMTNIKTLALAAFAVASLGAGAAMAQEGGPAVADTYWSSPAVPSATAYGVAGATRLHSSSYHVNTTRYNPNLDESRTGVDSSGG